MLLVQCMKFSLNALLISFLITGILTIRFKNEKAWRSGQFFFNLVIIIIIFFLL